MKNILVLFGGKSSEYEVSLRSAFAVITNMPKDKYNPVLMGITKEGKWFLYEDDINLIPDNSWLKAKCTPAAISTDFGEKCVNVFREDGMEKISIDAVFC